MSPSPSQSVSTMAHPRERVGSTSSALLPPPAFRAVGMSSRPGSPLTWQERLARLRTLRAPESLDARPGVAVRVRQLVDAEAIAGERHVATALARAERARRLGSAHLQDPSAEFALYLAGSDQLPEALQRVGVSASTRQFVLVESPALLALEEVSSRLELESDPTAYPRSPGEKTLERLGLGPEDLRTVPREGWELLAIEAGAWVDLPGASGTRRKG